MSCDCTYIAVSESSSSLASDTFPESHDKHFNTRVVVLKTGIEVEPDKVEQSAGFDLNTSIRFLCFPLFSFFRL